MAGGGEGDGTPSLRGLTRVRLTHLDKVLYPAHHVTKQEVITHYVALAPRMLPFLADRPLTMHRFPDGVGGEDFFEKDTPPGTPDYVDLFTRWSETAGREVHYVLCNNLDTLIWIANLASLEVHITLSTRRSFESPDLLLFDIDPEPPVAFDDVIDLAHALREHLEKGAIRSFVKTSGKKGLHVVVPLRPGYHFEEIRAFAHRTAKIIGREIRHVVTEFSRSRDPGTIFIDYLQNAHGKTMAAPYSLRATPGATVSAPLGWEELRHGVRPENFNIRTMLSRTEDPWRDILDARQKIGR